MTPILQILNVILTIFSVTYANKDYDYGYMPNYSPSYIHGYSPFQRPGMYHRNDEFYSSVSGINYLVVYHLVNWETAFNQCKEKNMELVSIDSEDEYKNVVDVLQRADRQISSIWTSGTDLKNEKNFYWASNNKCFTYGLWHNGQPSHSQSMERCVELNRNGDTNYDYNYDSDEYIYKFNDKRCDREVYFMCSN